MQLANVLYFLLWAGFFVLMMHFGCGAHIMGHSHGKDSSADSHNSGSAAAWAPPMKAIDPVCGMKIETATAKSAVYSRHVYYFCSQSCRDKFEAAPAAYTTQGAPIPLQKEMHNGH